MQRPTLKHTVTTDVVFDDKGVAQGFRLHGTVENDRYTLTLLTPYTTPMRPKVEVRSDHLFFPLPPSYHMCSEIGLDFRSHGTSFLPVIDPKAWYLHLLDRKLHFSQPAPAEVMSRKLEVRCTVAETTPMVVVRLFFNARIVPHVTVFHPTAGPGAGGALTPHKLASDGRYLLIWWIPEYASYEIHLRPPEDYSFAPCPEFRSRVEDGDLVIPVSLPLIRVGSNKRPRIDEAKWDQVGLEGLMLTAEEGFKNLCRDTMQRLVVQAATGELDQFPLESPTVTAAQRLEVHLREKGLEVQRDGKKVVVTHPQLRASAK